MAVAELDQLPRNVIQYDTDNFIITVRPSGTEPKLRVMIEGEDEGRIDEMARRASARGYTWVDLSITGEDNTDTFPLAHRMVAKIYKRYRFYRKELTS